MGTFEFHPPVGGGIYIRNQDLYSRVVVECQIPAINALRAIFEVPQWEQVFLIHNRVENQCLFLTESFLEVQFT